MIDKLLPGLAKNMENNRIPFFTAQAGLNEKSYFLSNQKMFFHRYADTGFKTKWTGLWSGNRKFLEFFAIKAFGLEWLGEHTTTEFYYDYSMGVHTHKIGDLEIDQLVWMPKDKQCMVVELLSNKPLSLEVLLAVNMRNREENLHSRAYAIDQKGGLSVSSSLGTIKFIPLNGKFE